MRDWQKHIPLFFFLLGVAALVFLAAPTWASGGDCNGNDNCDDVIIDAGSSVNTDISDSSRVTALSLGDVDIAQCYRSYQVVVLWQGTQINKWCMADSLDARGLHEAAGVMRCSLKAYAKNFPDEQTCVDFSTIVVQKAVPVDTSPAIDEQRYYQLEAQMAEMQMQLDREPAPAPATTTTRVIQQPFLSDEKRAKLQAILDEDEDE